MRIINFPQYDIGDVEVELPDELYYEMINNLLKRGFFIPTIGSAAYENACWMGGTVDDPNFHEALAFYGFGNSFNKMYFEIDKKLGIRPIFVLPEGTDIEIGNKIFVEKVPCTMISPNVAFSDVIIARYRWSKNLLSSACVEVKIYGKSEMDIADEFAYEINIQRTSEGMRIYDMPDEELVRGVYYDEDEDAFVCEDVRYSEILSCAVYFEPESWVEFIMDRLKQRDAIDRTTPAGFVEFALEYAHRPYLPALPENYLKYAAKGDSWERFLKNIEEATGGIFVKKLNEDN